MPIFTNETDAGQYVVEYDRIYYGLMSNDLTVNFSIAYKLETDGSDKENYESDAIERFNAVCAMFPGKTWKMVKNVQNKKEQYIPAIPMSESDFIPEGA